MPGEKRLIPFRFVKANALLGFLSKLLGTKSFFDKYPLSFPILLGHCCFLVFLEISFPFGELSFFF